MTQMIKRQHSSHTYRDWLKLLFLITGLAGALGILLWTPALRSPFLIALILSTFVSPSVVSLEKKGISRSKAIAIVLCFLLFCLIFFSIWVIRSGISQWDSLIEVVPEHFGRLFQKLGSLEDQLKTQYPIVQALNPTSAVSSLGHDTAQWFADHGASILGEMLSWLFLIPLFSLRRTFLKLIPNRFFESCFHITTHLSKTISNYLRAKLLEASLVGLLVTTGLCLIQAPYAVVLGIIAAITNIIPYLGPFLGAGTGLIAVAYDERHLHHWPGVLIVFLIANLVDMAVIFPLLVAKLVKLHPFILIAAVLAGQRYYGLIGMLISIPVASGLKIILQELYVLLYDEESPPGGGAQRSDLCH
jgi:putative permease